MSATVNSTLSAPVPTESTGDNFPNTSNGIGAATYYGSVALAVFIILCITLVSRVLYTRKMRIATRRRHEAERMALDRRGEEPGLPTYTQSRATQRVWDAPPPVEPTDTEDQPASTHFHFHLPSWPAAVHLGRRNSHDSIAPPVYAPPPPKYDEAAATTTDPTTPPVEGSPPATTEVPIVTDDQGHDETRSVQGFPQHVEEDDFIHPEERRRRERDRDNIV